ncbi:MAG: exo 1,3/1,4-beta-D-glucan glucohydrolase [Pseudomonadota bacterium]
MAPATRAANPETASPARERSVENAGVADPQIWSTATDPVPENPAIEARIAELLAAMSIEQKVGQIIQADLGSVTPEDVARYHLGSVLNGGNSAPGGQAYATGPEWLAEADRFHAASVRPQDGLPTIPLIWGSDAVHGHNNVIGATLFPHNIGLGATRNPDLMRRIGEITAVEMRVTGLDWTFAPTIAVPQDDRWGRTYEGFSEHPEIVASYAAPLIEGLQGEVGDSDWLTGSHIIATAKHFLGDGATEGGRDQGDSIVSETELRDIQAAGYIPAIEAGVQSVMVSFSSWQGRKMHGNRSLLTGVLRDRFDFGGFLVGDWNGHGQVAGCAATSCAQSVNAGLDMYMAPDSWRDLYTNTLAQVRSGEISMARLDEAVARILRVKLRAGIFDAGPPSSRELAGQFDLLGAPDHRAVAREAVRQSLVLLKNENDALPLRAGQHILVTGDGADNAMKQSGGWTLTWQGTGLTPDDFPGATTIWQGLDHAADRHGATTELSETGEFDHRPDVAIVVFGENPYAEFQGDIDDVAFRDTANSLELLRNLRGQGIATVAIFLSGRPLWVNRYLNASDAFVAAWLPGSEGGGVADVLFGDHDFSGRLSFSWPRDATQAVLNIGDENYDPLFAYGYGLSYAAPGRVGPLSEDSGLATESRSEPGLIYGRGETPAGYRFYLAGSDGAAVTIGGTGAASGDISARRIDHVSQEDSWRLSWTGAGTATAAIEAPAPLNWARESNGDIALEVTWRVIQAPSRSVSLMMACGDNCAGQWEIGGLLGVLPTAEWTTTSFPLSCFADRGADVERISTPFALRTAGALELDIARIALGSGNEARQACP